MKNTQNKQAGERTQHTPGPWHFGELSRVISAEAGKLVCQMDDREDDSGGFNIQALADARLIAAAPELLAAVKAAVEFCRYIAEDNAHPSLQEVIDMRITALAAIAKAEGNS